MAHVLCLHVCDALIETAIVFLIRLDDVNVVDNFGMTPLHWACHRPDGIALVEILLFLGAKIEELNDEDMTPLDCAKRYRFQHDFIVFIWLLLTTLIFSTYRNVGNVESPEHE